MIVHFLKSRGLVTTTIPTFQKSQPYPLTPYGETLSKNQIRSRGGIAIPTYTKYSKYIPTQSYENKKKFIRRRSGCPHPDIYLREVEIATLFTLRLSG